MFIRTERLFLRPAWVEDMRDLHSAIADERVVRQLARAPWPFTPEDACAYVACEPKPRYPHFVITLPGASGAKVIGGIGLTDEHGAAQLGFWLTPDAWGRGYATEAVGGVVQLARALDHRCVNAWHFLDNPAAGRVLEKAGLRRTNRIEDHYGHARGAAFPARGYVLRFDGAYDRDSGPELTPGCDEGMQAA